VSAAATAAADAQQTGLALTDRESGLHAHCKGTGQMLLRFRAQADE